MSNTSTSNDKTAVDDAKVKLIIGEIGRDTQTGIIGRGYSFDNGRTFHVTDTIYGRLYDDRDVDGLWNNGMHEKVKEKVNQEITNTVEPAIKQADSAVAYANDAIEKSRVNSQAIVDINSAVSDAVSDAAVARSDGLRAWNAAQSNADLIDQNYASASAAISSARTEAIAAADEAKASASAAQADIVAVQSDVAAVQADVTATKSDVAVAKSAIADTKTSLTSQAKSLSSYAAQASAAGKDITTLKSQAGQFEQDMADTKGDVSQLKVSASSASVALSDAAGNISSLQATAKSYSAALSDTNSNVASVTATASELETKYADAAGDINKLQTDAKGTAQTLADAQGDIAKLKIRADGFDTEFASTNGDINKLQTDATGTKQTLTNAKSDIAVLQSRADGFDAKYADVAGDINTIKVNASGMQQTLTDAKGDISTLQATATGFKNTLTDAQGNISTLQSDVSGLKKTTSDHAGNIATLQSDAKTLTSQMSSAQGDISTLKQTATSLDSKYEGVSGDLNNLKSQAQWVTVTDTVDLNNIKTPCHKFLKGVVTNAPNETAWWYLTVEGSESGRITQTVIADQSNNRYTRRLTDSWSAWVRDATQTDVTALSNRITTNSTQITQNKQAITLKADQTTVDQTNGTVQQLQSQLKVQADQIASKVSSSDLDAKGYATQEYTQSLITQKAGTISESIVKLDQTVKQGAENNVQLVRKSDFEDDDKGGWSVQAVVATDPPAELGQSGMKVLQTNVRDDYEDGIWYSVKPGEKFDVDFWCKPSTAYPSNFGLAFNDKDHNNWNWLGIVTDQSGQWKHYTGTITAPANASFAKPWFQMDKDASNTTDTALLAKPSIRRQNATTVAAIQQITASIDGLQSNVKNFKNDTSSQITQLSDVVQSKVSQGDYNSQITQLKDDINLRVTKGNVISQINQEAGGNTLIKVSNGKGALILDAGNTIITGKTWIPVACIADLTADKIKAGTLTGSTVHLDDGNGNTIDLGGLATNYVGFHSKATNGDQTYIDCNGIHNYGASYDTKISQGKITTNLLAVNGGGLIDFRSSGSGITIDSQNIKFYNSNAVNGGIEFSGGNPIATVRDGTIGNELRVRYDRSFALTPIKDESARICASSAAMQVGFIQSGSSTPDLNTTGLWVDNDNRRVNLGVWGADSTWARVEASTHNIHMQAGNAHAWLGNDNVFHIYKDNDGGSSTATKLQVDGWAWVKGWVEAAGHSQHSALSTKTNIQPVDDDKMLKMVNDTDLTTFLYKMDVASGETHRHIGLIIDDVHDVAQYQTPQDFIAPNGVSRDDDNMIGALFGAVKALTKRIKTLESKVG